MRYFVVIFAFLIAALTYALWLIPLPFPTPAILSHAGVKPPACLALSNMILFGDWFLRFQVPKEITVNASDSPDSTMFWIDGSSETAKLVIGEGPLWDSWEHFSQFESQEKNRHIQRSTYEDLDAIDITVRKANGTRSRLIGILGETARYEAVSETDSIFFDKIMETACFANPFQLQNSRMLKGPRPSNCRHYIVRPLAAEECIEKN